MAALLGLLLVLALAATGRAQELTPLPDPYTKGDGQAWAAAGYEPARLLPWGDDHSSSDIEELLGEVPLLWVETAHFMLGSSLPEIDVERESREAVRDELKQLGQRLPRVKLGTKALDRWLRLHLYAQRLEQLYADFEELVGVSDADFPAADPEAPAPVGSGGGPYLGLRGKFRVLLLEQRSSLGRYAQRYCGGDDASPLRTSSAGRDALVFATAAEFLEGAWDNDQALRCHVTWSVTQNLLAGLGGYRFHKPRWLGDGLAHVLARRVDERFPSFSALDGSRLTAMQEPDWPPRIRGRVKFGLFPKAAELHAWAAEQPLPATEQMTTLARVEHLLALDRQAFGRCVRMLALSLDTGGQVPDHAQVERACRAALAACFALDDDSWDERFASWVLATYPKR